MVLQVSRNTVLTHCHMTCKIESASLSCTKCGMSCCSYKVEGDEQTATAELRGLRVVTQINLGSAEPSAPTSEVCLNHPNKQNCFDANPVNSGTSGTATPDCAGIVVQCQLRDYQVPVMFLAQLLYVHEHCH